MSAEKLDIMNPHISELAPESLLVAQNYMQFRDAGEVANVTGIPEGDVQKILGKREVKAFLDQVSFQMVEKNIDQIQDRFQDLIDRKFEEMEETELGSKKDIAELLESQAKMQMDLMKLRIKLMETETKKAEQAAKQIINMQINNQNNTPEVPGYEKLIGALLEGKK